MKTEQVTDWLWRLNTPAVNVYAVRERDGFNLIDTGLPGTAEEILDALAKLAGGTATPVVHEIVLTHGHRDHAGSARRLAEVTDARVLGPSADARLIEAECDPPEPILAAWEVPLFEGLGDAAGDPPPPVHLDQRIEDGENLHWERPASVIAAPGHTPGSVALLFAEAKVLVAGDAIASANGEPILGVFNADPEQAEETFRRLAALDLEIACFGHGDPLLSKAGSRLAEKAGRVQECR